MKNFHKYKGFTLIELMLVITIILILMGFLVPKVSAYQEKARNAKAVNTAKQIETAAMASYGNNDSKFDGSDVTTTVQQLTSAKNISVSNASDQSVNIAYVSDDKNYSVEINASDSTYIVKYGDKQIFPKN